jgi:hypothetical protein
VASLGFPKLKDSTTTGHKEPSHAMHDTPA